MVYYFIWFSYLQYSLVYYRLSYLYHLITLNYMEETPSVLVLSTHGVIYLFVSDIFFFDQLSLMFHKCIHLEQLQLIWVISWLHPFIQIDSLFYLLGQIPLVLALLYWDCHLIFKRIFFFFFKTFCLVSRIYFWNFFQQIFLIVP